MASRHEVTSVFRKKIANSVRRGSQLEVRATWLEQRSPRASPERNTFLRFYACIKELSARDQENSLTTRRGIETPDKPSERRNSTRRCTLRRANSVIRTPRRCLKGKFIEHTRWNLWAPDNFGRFFCGANVDFI